MKTKKLSRKKGLLILASFILVAICSYGAYALSAEKWPFSPTPTQQTAEKTKLYGSGDTNPDPNTPESSDSSNSGSIGSTKEPNKSAPADISDDITPRKPSGTFVSNHHPNLSGHPAPNSMSSTCTTTPGATCQIRFTMGKTTKELPLKTANAGGNISWEWTLQDINLSAGDWKVTAIATNGDKATEASDPMLLSVRK